MAFRVSVLLVLLVPLALSAQGRAPSSRFRQAVDYDGNLTFTRLIYGSGLRNFGFGGIFFTLARPMISSARI